MPEGSQIFIKILIWDGGVVEILPTPAASVVALRKHCECVYCHGMHSLARAAVCGGKGPQAGPSPVVVEAVWELLDACVAGIRLQGAEEAASGGRGRHNADKFAEWQPRARWYDAR